MEKLILQVPSFAELGYRQTLLADPATMSYNAGCGLTAAGYDDATGTIDFAPAAWRGWYDRWVGCSDRYYAYARRPDGVPVGEVDLRSAAGAGWYEMGVVIQASWRGRGYGGQALGLLMHQAFDVMKVPAVHNCFQAERQAALAIHRAVGFTVTGPDPAGMVWLTLTAADYRAAQDRRG